MRLWSPGYEILGERWIGGWLQGCYPPHSRRRWCGCHRSLGYTGVSSGTESTFRRSGLHTLHYIHASRRLHPAPEIYYKSYCRAVFYCGPRILFPTQATAECQAGDTGRQPHIKRKLSNWLRKHFFYFVLRCPFYSLPSTQPNAPGCVMDRSPTPQTPYMLTAPSLPWEIAVADLCENFSSFPVPVTPLRRRRPSPFPTGEIGGEEASRAPRCRW
jgi:hypothetical protein